MNAKNNIIEKQLQFINYLQTEIDLITQTHSKTKNQDKTTKEEIKTNIDALNVLLTQKYESLNRIITGSYINSYTDDFTDNRLFQEVISFMKSTLIPFAWLIPYFSILDASSIIFSFIVSTPIIIAFSLAAKNMIDYSKALQRITKGLKKDALTDGDELEKVMNEISIIELNLEHQTKCLESKLNEEQNNIPTNQKKKTNAQMLDELYALRTAMQKNVIVN